MGIWRPRKRDPLGEELASRLDWIVCTGTAARLAIKANPGWSGLIGSSTVRVPSGKMIRRFAAPQRAHALVNDAGGLIVAYKTSHPRHYREQWIAHDLALYDAKSPG